MPDSHFHESDLKNYVASLTGGANEIGDSLPWNNCIAYFITNINNYSFDN